VTFAARIERRHADRVLDDGVVREEREPSGLVLLHDVAHRGLSGASGGVFTSSFHMCSQSLRLRGEPAHGVRQLGTFADGRNPAQQRL
jgi:hypothetical protein